MCIRDSVDRETARELGMKVANVDYPPNGVANFAIMLMLMSLRKADVYKRQTLSTVRCIDSSSKTLNGWFLKGNSSPMGIC